MRLPSHWKNYTFVIVVVLCLTIAQCFFTQAALERTSYEELAESLRNPYWASQGAIYDQWSSNVGWYGLLASVYSIVGYDIYLAKWVRVALHACSLSALACLFVNWLGPRAIALLLVVGLSPTWLYCNTYQTSYGIDLQLIPILLLLLNWLIRSGSRFEVPAFTTGAMVSIGGLCYPTVIFYLPFVIVIAVAGVASNTELKQRWKRILGVLIVFLLGSYVPIGVALSYFRDPEILLKGLFRGGGATISFRADVLLNGTQLVLSDLFVRAGSYCFDLPYVEFSSWPAFAVCALTFCGIIVYLAFAKWAGPHAVGMFIAIFVIFWFLLAPSAIPNSPGIRRSTGILVGYYAAFCFLMSVLWNRSMPWLPEPRQGFAAWCLLLLHIFANGTTLAHNVRMYRNTADTSNEAWITIQGNPQDSLEHWFRQAQDGKPIQCENFGRGCRFAVRFAGVKALQYWNDRGTFPVYGVDPITKNTRLLSLSIWENYEWPH